MLKINTLTKHLAQAECFFNTLNPKGGDKMKVKVVVSFNDKMNGSINRPVNEVFECTKERAESLMGRGFVVAVQDTRNKNIAD
jgi:hypothetical protein